MSIEEFSSLSSKMEDRMVRIAELERQLAEEKAHSREVEEENRALNEEIVWIKAQRDEAKFVNEYLRHYIILSAEKIREFMMRLKNIDRWSFLRSFIEWSLPDEYRNEEKKLIEEVMVLPNEDPRIIMNQPQFDGPMYDVHDNDDVDITK